MSFLVREKSFYKMLAAITIPIALQNLIGFGVNMMDSIMLGALGEVPLSAVSLANQVFFILMLLSFGLASGGAVLIAQYWGKKDIKTVGKITSMTLSIVTVVSLIFTVLVLCFPEQIMRIYTNEEAVIAGGIEYLRWVAVSYIFFGIGNTYAIMLRSVEQVRFSLYIYAASFFINVFFNWMFIFGNLGAPKMGIAGAALGTVIARAFEFIAIGVFALKFEKIAKISLKNMLHFDRWLIADYFRHSMPVVFNELLWGIGASLYSAAFGRMGAAAVAAGSIVGVVVQLNTVVIFGIGNAAGVIIGKAIGAKKSFETLMSYAKTLELLAFAIGIVGFAGVALLGTPIIGFYNLAETTKEMARQTMWMAAAVVFFVSFEITGLVGILRAGGNVKFVLKLDMIFMWAVAIPLGFAAALIFQMPLFVVYALLRVDTVLKSIVGTARILRGKWIKNITRDFADDNFA